MSTSLYIASIPNNLTSLTASDNGYFCGEVGDQLDFYPYSEFASSTCIPEKHLDLRS